MRLFNLLILLLFVVNCGSSGGNTSVSSSNGNDNIKSRAMESSNTASTEKISACSSFKSTEDCVNAKEINFTLAYYLGSKGDSQVYSMSKQDSSRPQITKLKSSKDLEDIKKRIIEEKYLPASSEKNISLDDIIQYIQDDKEGQGSGKSPSDVKRDRALAIQDAESKRKSEESDASKRIREKMQKEIEAYPYIFEVSCTSFDDSRLDLDQCGAKLRPTLKITSEKKVIYSFSYIDFISGSVNSQLKLPKDFSFEMTSSGQDSSKLLVAIIKNRTLKDDPTGKVVFSTGKVFTKIGQNVTIVP